MVGTDEIRGEIKNKDNKWKKYLTTRRAEDYDVYKRKSNEVKIAVRETEEKSWTQNDSLLRYTMLNIMNKEGNTITEEDKIMERWRGYFEPIRQRKRKTNKK